MADWCWLFSHLTLRVCVCCLVSSLTVFYHQLSEWQWMWQAVTAVYYLGKAAAASVAWIFEQWWDKKHPERQLCSNVTCSHHRCYRSSRGRVSSWTGSSRCFYRRTTDPWSPPSCWPSKSSSTARTPTTPLCTCSVWTARYDTDV